MNYEELCAALRSECDLDYDYVVELKYFYFSETLGIFDEKITYEIFNNSVDGIVWFNDWYEGQDYCSYNKPIKVIDLIRLYYTTSI